MGLAKAAFDQQKAASCETHYYGYLDKQDILQDIIQHKQANADVRINLVGHSRGGAVANAIALNELNALNINVNLLVLLDPVKAKQSDNYILPTDKNATNANIFICIYANPEKRDPTDYVAKLGGHYAKRLQAFCDFYVEADVNHGDPMKMLQTALDSKVGSAWNILINESRKL